MSIHARRTLAACGFLLLAHVALGDEVVMHNGDRLTGIVKTSRDGKLVLNTTYAGEIEIQLTQIQRMVTDNPVALVLDDGTRVSGILFSTEDNEMEILADVDSGQQPLSITRISAVNPPEVPQLKVTGQINTGVDRNRGNTDKENYHVDLETLFRWFDARLRIRGDGDLQYADSRKTKQRANLNIKHDYFFDKDDYIFHEKWYLSSSAQFEHDDNADLNLRTSIALGPGYQILETERTDFSVEGGPAHVWENFKSDKNNQYASARWALDFKHQIFKTWKLVAFHDHQLRWSLEDRKKDDYVFDLKTGLHIPIYGRLQATVQFNFQRDNEPSDDANKNDYETLITGGYTW